MIGKCPQCEGEICVSNMFEKKCGFSNQLLFQCGKCNWKASFYTSLPLEKTNKEVRSPGQVGFDINSRIVLSFREIGKGYQAISDFAMHMNITPPFSKKFIMPSVINYTKHTLMLLRHQCNLHQEKLETMRR